MDATRFEVTVSIPRDVRFAATVRRLAVHAARYAGCAEAAAEAFGTSVEQAINAHLETGATDAAVPLVVRRRDGPVEVVIDGRRSITVDV